MRPQQPIKLFTPRQTWRLHSSLEASSLMMCRRASKCARALAKCSAVSWRRWRGWPCPPPQQSAPAPPAPLGPVRATALQQLGHLCLRHLPETHLVRQRLDVPPDLWVSTWGPLTLCWRRSGHGLLQPLFSDEGRTPPRTRRGTGRCQGCSSPARRPGPLPARLCPRPSRPRGGRPSAGGRP